MIAEICIAFIIAETRPVENFYPLATVVVEANTEEDIVTLEDGTGNL